MKRLIAEQVTRDQNEILQLVDDVLPSLPDLEAAEETGQSGSLLLQARQILVESGLWSIGIDESLGGGGAPIDLRQVALAALGGTQPGLAWALAQTEAAAQILAVEDSLQEELEALVSGQRAAAVVNRSDPQVRLTELDGTLSGSIDRIDLCGADAVLVILDHESAWVIQAPAFRLGEAKSTTGLAGMMTVSAAIEEGHAGIIRVPADVGAIRSRLQVAGAAIAAGLALAAADAAATYSTERIQFGGPLTALPTVRQSLATQSADAVSALRDSLFDAVPESSRAAVLLRQNCERALSVAGDALLSHGGYGYLHEYRVERLVRDAVSLRAATGARAAFTRVAERFAPR